jgi:GNAT superfamily N-acetyltransferase
LRVAAEKRANVRAVSRLLWQGLTRYNLEAGGPFRYSRRILTVRSDSGRVLGGVILRSYWNETFVELLWLSKKARRQGCGRLLMAEAERRARRRGSVLMHLDTYSFQAPGFYEKLGFRRFGSLRGSPRGASRHWYVKQL